MALSIAAMRPSESTTARTRGAYFPSIRNDPAGKLLSPAAKRCSATFIGTDRNRYRSVTMLLEPRCATAIAAVPVPVVRPLGTTVVTGATGADKMARSAISTTSTFIASPIEGLDLLLGASYNDISVKLPGGEVPSVQSPKWIFNAMARYEFDIGYGKLAFQADGIYRDKHYFALTGIETVEEDGYALANVSVSWTDPEENWQVSAFIDNVTDEEYLLQTFDLSGPAVFGMTEQYFGKPRWWGISARYQWGE